MTDHNAPELLPCPFCGGEADIDHDHTVEENHAYGCRNCSVWFDTFNSDDAIAAWNTRADLLTAAQARAEPAEAEVKRLREALAPFAKIVDKDGEPIVLKWGKSTYSHVLFPKHFYAAAALREGGK